MLRERLEREGAFDLRLAPLAAPVEIALAHDAAYVSAFLDGSPDAAAMRRIGFPWSPELARRTLASVGATLSATRDAVSAGFGGALSGGTHHAFRSHGSGFCVFNDIAVALHSNPSMRPAAVIDLDVHQGDGTAAMFDGDASVLTLSMHGRSNFPFRKQRSWLDIELDDGAGDAEYLDRLGPALGRILDARPCLVFYLAGVDPLAEDRLGKLSLTAAGLRARDELVLRACRALGAPVVLVLGGGYAEPIELTVDAHAATFLTAREWY